MNNDNQQNDAEATPGPTDAAPAQDLHQERSDLIRDVIVFQFRLAMDGARDVLLSPVSIASALFGIFFGGDRPGQYFYALLQWGHKTDRWIGLFSAGDDKYSWPGDTAGDPVMTSGNVVDQIEHLVKEEFKNNEKLAATRDSIDGIIGKMRKED